MSKESSHRLVKTQPMAFLMRGCLARDSNEIALAGWSDKCERGECEENARKVCYLDPSHLRSSDITFYFGDANVIHDLLNSESYSWAYF